MSQVSRSQRGLDDEVVDRVVEPIELVAHWRGDGMGIERQRKPVT